MWRAFLIAARFLTRLPLPDPGPVSGAELGRCALWFPLLGLVIGSIVWASAILATKIGFPDADLAAALVLVVWVWLTGGLHLDGLADTADAWVGGLGDRNRTLEIMQDSRSGPFGVIALILVLLCKWAALSALIAAGALAGLIWISILARAQLLVLFLTTAYARPEGMGAEIKAHLPHAAAWAWLAVALAVPGLSLGSMWFGLVLTAGVLFLILRRSMVARLGGFTGDTAGALVELSETLMLVAAVFFV